MWLHAREKVAMAERSSAAHLSSHGGKSGRGGIEVDFCAVEGANAATCTGVESINYDDVV